MLPSNFPTGRLSVSRPKDGWLPAALKRWWTTYGHCCAWLPVTKRVRALPVSPATLCAAHPKVAIAVGTTEPSVRRTKVHAAVDTLGHRLALRIILAAEQDRWLQESTLAATVQEAYGQNVEVAYNGRRIQRGESAEGARCRASGLRW